MPVLFDSINELRDIATSGVHNILSFVWPVYQAAAAVSTCNNERTLLHT